MCWGELRERGADSWRVHGSHPVQTHPEELFDQRRSNAPLDYGFSHKLHATRDSRRRDLCERRIEPTYCWSTGSGASAWKSSYVPFPTSLPTQCGLLANRPFIRRTLRGERNPFGTNARQREELREFQTKFISLGSTGRHPSGSTSSECYPQNSSSSRLNTRYTTISGRSASRRSGRASAPSRRACNGSHPQAYRFDAGGG